ncbi:MAG: Tab2/Atab2 family RNA-binding protein [Gomphosphaeria aponina SAG 52.96 = DSM 107014]|uniref:Tab2/Atab2 family RNA-binding protein n=1 Tax=Gomphosphaeria aponina SAG 52.96 = DSM 107014 TaxID=1521640 RepID=A0A941GN82_9CHRO|nr:Tab2/Atab2 family RNA-binding protein [Gomphosphaeria aponina SAG 52.96 = DSM 107014]
MNTIWELDFYSRPLIDENKKKKWELLICESPQKIEREPDSLFKYAQECPSNTVNSLWLRETLAKAIAAAPSSPKKIRFFRRQMNNMITKACEELDIPAVPSRHTYALNQWLEERLRDFYPDQPGYDRGAANSASVQYPASNAVPLPDAVRGDKGDKWAFVTLETAAFTEMNEWDIAFGEAFPLSMISPSAQVTPPFQKESIPGVIIFSSRALPLAGWMSGLELGFLEFEDGKFPRIRLETGVSDSWILANITDPKTLAEARGFARAKKEAQQVHFLAIQANPEAESFAGFWLLLGG